MVSNLTTLFLGKPHRGSLPVLSVHSFASDLQLALYESAEKGKTFPRKNVPDAMFDLGTAYRRSVHGTDRATASTHFKEAERI